MSEGRRQSGVMRALSMLAYGLAGAIVTTGAFYFLFFAALFLFPTLPDRLELGTLLILVGIPIPSILAGACLGVYLWRVEAPTEAGNYSPIILISTRFSRRPSNSP